MLNKNIVIISTTFALMTLLAPIVRFFTKSSSYFPIFPQPALITVSILICVGVFCQFFSALQLTSQLKRTKFPYEGLPNCIIIYFGFLISVLSFTDIGFQRATQIRANPSFLQVSVFPRRALFKVAYEEAGAKIEGNTNIEELIDQYTINPVLWPVMTAALFGFAVVLIGLLFAYIKNSCKSLGLRPRAHERENKDIKIKAWFQWFSAVYAVCCFALFLAYLLAPNGKYNQLDMVAPASWVFLKSGLHDDISGAQEKSAIQWYRKNVELPDDRDWLDQRQNPVFPLVTAPTTVVKAYNGRNYKAKTYLKRNTERFSGKTPDIVTVIIESFSPTPYYMDKAYLSHQSGRVYEGPVYSDEYLPNLRKIQMDGLGFSGLASNSLPTFGGWFSLMVGDYQVNYGTSMVLDQYNDVDDLGSFMRGKGYYANYLSTSDTQFDSKMQYLFRGKEQVYGPKHLKQFPMEFDEIHHYFPTKSQAQGLGLTDLPKATAWVCDRVTRHQVIKMLDDYKGTAPLFTTWTTVDTHTPFKGYDSKDQYDQYTVNKGLNSDFTEQGMGDRYSTIVRYTDAQLGELYDYLKSKRNNTILVVVGDHGARDLRTFQSYNTVHNATFCARCQGKAFGNEELFTTTGVVTYLGDDPQIRQLFSNRGKVYTGVTDHQDLAYTLQELVSWFSHEDFVSSRQGRNLFQLFNDDTLKHISMRNTGLSLEVGTEKQLIRSNYLTNYDGLVIQDVSYPTCITERNETITNLSMKQFNEFLLLSSLFTKLSHENRNFNYKFRDLACMDFGNCTFPKPTGAYKSPVLWSFYAVLPAMVLAVCVVIFAINQCISKKLNIKYESIIETTTWWKFNTRRMETEEFTISDKYV